jgi:hypothetical protein
MKKTTEEEPAILASLAAVNRPLSVSTRESVTDVIRRLTKKTNDLPLKGIYQSLFAL